MEISKEDLIEASVFKNKQIRDEVLQSDLSSFTKKQIDRIKDLIDDELRVIAIEAQEQAELYWISALSIYKEHLNTSKLSTGTRVRILNNSVVCEWYKSKFKYSPKNKKGTTKIRSTYIPKKNSDKYSKTDFNYEIPEIKELIYMVEDEYQKIRKRSKALTKIRQAINLYERILNEK